MSLRMVFFLCCLTIFILSRPFFSWSQQDRNHINLTQAIERALQRSFKIEQSQHEIISAQENKKSQKTRFFPLFHVKYDYIHRDEPAVQSLNFIKSEQATEAIVNPQDEFQFTTSFTQPIFTGFELLNQYEISRDNVELAEFSYRIICRDTILDVINAYFSVLKQQKLVDVANDAVRQLSSQKKIATHLYQAGKAMKTDLLQAEVELANAKQDLTRKNIKLRKAKSEFNTLLQRPLSSPVNLVESAEYLPFEHTLKYCLSHARTNRIEIKMAEKDVQISEKEHEIQKFDIFPDIELTGTWTRRGTDYLVDGGPGIGDKNFWDIRVSAHWDIWDWGRRKHEKSIKYQHLSKSRSIKNQITSEIDLEVNEAYLTMTEIAENIANAEVAIEQAQENLRITKEKYKSQVITMIDCLTAQTLLTETLTNYYNALYDFNIAKAVLYRAIGQKKYRFSRDPESLVDSQRFYR